MELCFHGLGIVIYVFEGAASDAGMTTLGFSSLSMTSCAFSRAYAEAGAGGLG